MSSSDTESEDEAPAAPVAVGQPSSKGDMRLFVKSMQDEFNKIAHTCDAMAGICATFLGEVGDRKGHGSFLGEGSLASA